MRNEAFQNASFGNASFPNKALSYSCLWAQSLAEQTDFLGVFIQNRARHEGRKLPENYAKSTNFSSIACTNVGSLSMSFGCKIFNGSGGMSLQS